jgi:hypothetical protein
MPCLPPSLPVLYSLKLPSFSVGDWFSFYVRRPMSFAIFYAVVKECVWQGIAYCYWEVLWFFIVNTTSWVRLSVHVYGFHRHHLVLILGWVASSDIGICETRKVTDVMWLITDEDVVSRDSSVSIMTRLRAGRPRFVFRQMQGFCFSPPRPDRLWGPSSLVPNGFRWLFPWV